MQIRWTGDTGRTETTDLFGLIALLAADRPVSFPALRSHQRHPLHAFCCQIAASALIAAGRTDVPIERDTWKTLLLALTPEYPDGEAWKLVGDDWSKPALLQPPGMSPSLRNTPKKTASTPDQLDMLRTGRNNDLKGSRMFDAEDDDWLFAMLSLQTQDGREGPGLDGISRMNGAYGSRVAVSVQPAGDRPGQAFRRDTEKLLTLRESITSDSPAKGDLVLMWLVPWDGTKQLSMKALDPYYVDVCRLCRLMRDDQGRLRAILATAKNPRVSAKAFNGMTGDPWAPTRNGEDKSWGVSVAGFGYRQISQLLDPKLNKRSALGTPGKEDLSRDLVLKARAVTRGQGKTEGYHERTLPIPAAAAKRLSFSADQDQVATVCNARVQDASDAQRVLRLALMSLHQGGPGKIKLDDVPTAARVQRWLTQFDRHVDAAFFDDDFWSDVAEPERAFEHFGRPWREQLERMARNIFTQAQEAAPRAEMRRLKARARSQNLFEGMLWRFVRSGTDEIEGDANPLPANPVASDTEISE